METWRAYLDALDTGLDDLAATAPGGADLPLEDAFKHWIEMTRAVHTSGGSIYIVGNGGSAMIASHFAADACKNAKLRAMAFNDAALLTAAGNDLAFSEIFAVPLTRLARAGDLLITISSSGNSPNIVRALEVARELALKIVTLSGKGPDNRSRTMGDVNFYIPADRYGWVESGHHVVMHYWIDQYLNLHGGGAL